MPMIARGVVNKCVTKQRHQLMLQNEIAAILLATFVVYERAYVVDERTLIRRFESLRMIVKGI